MEEEVERKKKFIINVAYYALIVILAWLALKYLISPMAPFIIAFVVASMLQGPARLIGGSARRKKWVSFLLCTFFYGLLFTLVIWAGLELLGGLESVIRRLPYLYNTQVVPIVDTLSEQLEKSLVNADPKVIQTVEDYIQKMVSSVGSSVSSFSMKILSMLSGGITGIPGFIVKVVIMVVATFFFAGDYDRIMNFFKGLLTPRQLELIRKGTDYVKNVLWIYIKSYTILFTMTFCELCAGLLLLGIPYAPLVALGIAIFDILPVLGTGGVLLPWAAILFVMENHGLALGILLLYLIILVVRNMAEPRIVGKQIGLHPLATLASMFLGLKLLGLIGLIAFPVSLTVLFGVKRENLFAGFGRDPKTEPDQKTSDETITW